MAGMKFKSSKIVTGVENRVSTKTNQPYILINFLNDNGSTFSTVCECEIPKELKQLDKCNVEFEVVPGRYTQLKTVAIEKV